MFITIVIVAIEISNSVTLERCDWRKPSSIYSKLSHYTFKKNIFCAAGMLVEAYSRYILGSTLQDPRLSLAWNTGSKYVIRYSIHIVFLYEQNIVAFKGTVVQIFVSQLQFCVRSIITYKRNQTFRKRNIKIKIWTSHKSRSIVSLLAITILFLANLKCADHIHLFTGKLS